MLQNVTISFTTLEEGDFRMKIKNDSLACLYFKIMWLEVIRKVQAILVLQILASWLFHLYDEINANQN